MSLTQKWRALTAVGALLLGSSLIAASSESVLTASPLLNGENFYVRLSSGFAWSQAPEARTSDHDNYALSVEAKNIRVSNSVPVELAVGYKWSEKVRIDVALGYRSPFAYHFKNNVNGEAAGKLYNMTALVHGYYDFDSIYGFRPYFGAGLGLSSNRTRNLVWTTPGVDGSSVEYGHHKSNLGFDLSAGFQTHLTGHLYLDISYRFSDLGRFRNSGGFSNADAGAASCFKTLYTHEVLLGLCL